MDRENSPSATPISVATFNVCAHAKNCGHWSGREAAVVKRILESDADVVAVQEGGTKIRRLHELLQPYGYDIPSYKYMSEDDAIFYRPSKLTVVPRPLETCENCEGFPNANTIAAGRGASGVWANLRVDATGKEYTFVSLHLQNGTSAKVSRLRKQQLRRITTWMTTKVAADDPIIYAGDFNSSRMRTDDSPRKELATAGYVDVFERSSSYAKAYVNTYNGYDRKPRRGVRYGDHIDRVFVRGAIGASSWAVVAPLRRGKNVRPMASDHYPVRVTLWLP
jgi:endonuclease/exonuclease/phosphatase family metal-dependent hydrolase